MNKKNILNLLIMFLSWIEGIYLNIGVVWDEQVDQYLDARSEDPSELKRKVLNYNTWRYQGMMQFSK